MLRNIPRVPVRHAQRVRLLASVASSSPVNPNTVGPFQVFDRHAKRLQKDRAAAHEDGQRSRTVDYVRDEVADRMIERFLVRPGFHLLTDAPAADACALACSLAQRGGVI